MTFFFGKLTDRHSSVFFTLSGLWPLDKATGFLRIIDQSAVGAD
jgi:hypothetical protein